MLNIKCNHTESIFELLEALKKESHESYKIFLSKGDPALDTSSNLSHYEISRNLLASLSRSSAKPAFCSKFKALLSV